jgi:hypothetical protein
MSEKESKKLFVGPSKSSWLKFKLAGVAWKLTRGNPLPYVGYIPGCKKLAMWSFKVRVMSRDFEVEEKE